MRFGEWSEWVERSGSGRTAREALSECGQRASFNWAKSLTGLTSQVCEETVSWYDQVGNDRLGMVVPFRTGRTRRRVARYSWNVSVRIWPMS